MVPPPTRPSAKAPAGGTDTTRLRLLRAGLQLFAQQGYAATTTRELAQAAGANVAAISYWFGDKSGLYRAVFFEPMGDPGCAAAALAAAPATLADGLRAFFAQFLTEPSQAEDVRLCVKLRMRELIEPTGLWDQEVQQGIGPLHHALVDRLRQHLGLPEPDDELHRLAVCLAALGVHLHLGRDVTDAVAPQLNQASDAHARWADCLLRQGLAMVEAEQRRRAAPPAPPAPPAAAAAPASSTCATMKSCSCEPPCT